jgi:sec-independent protein translocase protein TatB
MFDIGFPELLLVSVIALVVIGPEKLPETIRTLSLWLGRLKRSLATIKSEIEAEIGADDIRRQLRDESVLQGIEETKGQLEEIIDTARNDLTAISRSVTSDSRLEDADSDAAASAGNTLASPDPKMESSNRSSTEAADSDVPASPANKTESTECNPGPESQSGLKDDGRGG